MTKQFEILSQERIEQLIGTVLQNYALHKDGTHGLNHWLRVMYFGVKIAQQRSINMNFVILFALIHDSQRQEGWEDEEHGLRAAESLTNFPWLQDYITHEELEKLFFAIMFHNKGITSKDQLIQTCWDADRLDLPRVGISLDPEYFSQDTWSDQKLMKWAIQASEKEEVFSISEIYNEAGLPKRACVDNYLPHFDTMNNL
ncbi:MAG: hypothetical protein QNL04_08530 [SAR324 cluster bacterium]|nr:hypothetical protein [SAR324 cluster bacterium]